MVPSGERRPPRVTIAGNGRRRVAPQRRPLDEHPLSPRRPREPDRWGATGLHRLPLASTSRAMVDGARPSRPAIWRSESPTASTRETSSRSSSVRCRAARAGIVGRSTSRSAGTSTPGLTPPEPAHRLPRRVPSHSSTICCSVRLFGTYSTGITHPLSRGISHRSARCCAHPLNSHALRPGSEPRGRTAGYARSRSGARTSMAERGPMTWRMMWARVVHRMVTGPGERGPARRRRDRLSRVSLGHGRR